MSSTPLYSGVGSGSRYGDVMSMDDLKQKLKNRWPLSLFWNEAMLMSDLSALRQFIEEFTKYRTEVEQASNPSRKLQALYQLEKSYSSVKQDLVVILLELFQERAEQHLHPVPSVREVEKYFEALQRLSGKELQTPFKGSKHAVVYGFAGMLTFPDDATWQEEELKWFHENEANVKRQIGKAWCSAPEDLFQFDWKNHGGPVMRWFSSTLGQSACCGRYGFFVRLGYVTNHDKDMKMHWAALGWNIEKLLMGDLIDLKSCMCNTEEPMKVFWTLGSEVMGVFASDLAELQAILEGHQATVQGIRNKMLAGLLSAGVALANIASARIMEQWIAVD